MYSAEMEAGILRVSKYGCFKNSFYSRGQSVGFFTFKNQTG